jgi:hypothetical protein
VAQACVGRVHDHTALAFICAVGLIVLFSIWMLTGLRNAETSA